MSARLLGSIAVAAFVSLAVYTAVAANETSVRVINQTDSTHVVIQFDDAFYRSVPGRSDQFATGQLIHHVNVVTEKCSALASFDLLAGNDALVVVNGDGTVTVNPPGAVSEAYRGSALKISRPFDCPAPAVSLEVLLRNGLVVLAVASAVLALLLAARHRIAGRAAAADRPSSPRPPGH